MTRSRYVSPGQLSLAELWAEHSGVWPPGIPSKSPKKQSTSLSRAFDPDQVIEKLEATGDFRVLRRLQLPERFSAPKSGSQRTAVFVDCETTGLELTDKIIQIGLVRFVYDEETGMILGLDSPRDRYTAFEDPGEKLSEFIKDLTKISDSDVENKRFDDLEVKAFVEGAHIVIAHNAAFDRPRFEKRFKDIFSNMDWACSIRDVNWKEFKVSSAKLDYLAYVFGFFFDGHQALNDCFAGLEILSRPVPMTDGEASIPEIPVMKHLLESMSKGSWRHFADPVRGRNEDYRKLGYRWCNKERASSWYKDYPDESAAIHARETIASERLATAQEIRCITARDRYSTREMGHA